MNPNQRLSILCFPQFFDGSELHVNIVVMPRDHNPLNPIIAGEAPAIPDAETAFADAEFAFNAQRIQGFGVNPLPQPQAAADGMSVTTQTPTNARTLFESMANHFEIFNLDLVNTNANLQNIPSDRQFEKARPKGVTVKKHLPKSLRALPNFVKPKLENATTDDSYHCAVKAGKFYPGFQRSPETVNWGKVFAYLLRQPLMAREAGFVYSTTMPIDENTYPDGGFLYFDLAEGSSFFDQQAASDDFIKKYAARIPALTPGEPRQVFAPLLYPVVQVHDGNYDELFIETANFDDGFAKTVHCRQPPHRNLIEEEADGSFPTKDVGIQLCWSEITILKWYMRQLMQDSSVSNPDQRLDAPLGVLGYLIDVRQLAEEGQPENAWESLNRVDSSAPLVLANDPNQPTSSLNLGEFHGELPYQVYPMQLDGTEQATGNLQPYWLPMYFAAWNGHHMILPDPDAATIYHTTANVDADPAGAAVTDPDGNPATTGTGVSGGAQNNLNNLYNPGPMNSSLRYGNTYQFRVRMQDLSGGAPAIDRNPINETPTDIATCRFKRFVAPVQPRIAEIETVPDAQMGDSHPILSTDGPTTLPELNIRRPKLGYPAVVYTGKYTDPVQRLVDTANLALDVDLNDHSHNAEHRVGLGIADPDVFAIEIVVEVETLKLDKLASVSGREDYVHLYTTQRTFPAIDGNEDNFEANLNIPITYTDIQGIDKVLNTGNELNLAEDLGLADDIDALNELVLPTARTCRLTLRAVCEEKASDNETQEYYGLLDPANKQMNMRYGEPFSLLVSSPSIDETDLLVQSAGVPELQGIFMQPDTAPAFDGTLTTLFFGVENKRKVQQANVQQLADQLLLKSSGLTLNAKKGKRVVFGCSSRIRHTLAPDVSSITFASKSDLYNHWLCCISLEIDRDWMWNALETDAFIVRRTLKYVHEEQPQSENQEVGRLKIIRTASFEALDKPQRNSTRLVFIDAVEPKKPRQGGAPAFPDSIEVTYTLEPQFKEGYAEQRDELEPISMILPITTPPAQVPRIASAGIALSPYQRDENYANTGKRQRALWIEFEEPVLDPQDTIFARVLANAPDQLLSNNHPTLFIAPEEPPLPIADEPIRIITPASSNDLAGLNAMEPMIKSTTSDRHYLLPIPPGLHAHSDEMFGFFTYEFRIGHYEWPSDDPNQEAEKVWTTAQGRFGRRLKSTGIQHPAPALNIIPNRDEKKLWVKAPYATAVHQGKNVTADPPRTELWALLYAQVKQADGLDYRNILLDDRPLSWRVRINPRPERSFRESYSKQDLDLLNKLTFKIEKGAAELVDQESLFELVDFSNRSKSATRFGTTAWKNKTVLQLLAQCGLPDDSPLSVLVVEVLPQITDIYEHISELERPTVAQATFDILAEQQQSEFAQDYVKRTSRRGNQSAASQVRTGPSPVNERLGHHRILRVSNLVAVPEVCCTEC
ncbi:hypothetical protein [Croceiramulus getboli]|nr:hypothetical protein P8624_01880 [Flavobacteriaceae bacterium YJPT1-3]